MVEVADAVDPAAQETNQADDHNSEEEKAEET